MNIIIPEREDLENVRVAPRVTSSFRSGTGVHSGLLSPPRCDTPVRKPANVSGGRTEMQRLRVVCYVPAPDRYVFKFFFFVIFFSLVLCNQLGGPCQQRFDGVLSDVVVEMIYGVTRVFSAAAADDDDNDFV